MQNIETNLADASFQIRVSRKTIATLAKFFYQRTGYVPLTKSELGRQMLEWAKHLTVKHYNAEEFVDSAEATRFLTKLGLESLSVRGRDRAYQKQLQKETAMEGGVLAFDPFERPETVSKSKLPQEEQVRIDELVDQFEKGDDKDGN